MIMFMKFLRENRLAGVVLTFIRVYLGWNWLKAGWGKVTGDFDATGYLQGALSKASGENPTVQGWWASFLENVAIPNAQLFNILVPWGEVFVGLGLIVGGFTTLAVFFGIVMNFAFLLSGTLSTNPQMIILSLIVIIAGVNAGKIGIDRYIVPFVNKKLKSSKK